MSKYDQLINEIHSLKGRIIETNEKRTDIDLNELNETQVSKFISSNGFKSQGYGSHGKSRYVNQSDRLDIQIDWSFGFMTIINRGDVRLH